MGEYRSKMARPGVLRWWWLTRARWRALHALLYDLDQLHALATPENSPQRHRLWLNVHHAAEQLRTDLPCVDTSPRPHRPA